MENNKSAMNPITCEREILNPERKSCRFKNIQILVDGVLVVKYRVSNNKMFSTCPSLLYLFQNPLQPLLIFSNLFLKALQGRHYMKSKNISCRLALQNYSAYFLVITFTSILHMWLWDRVYALLNVKSLGYNIWIVTVRNPDTMLSSKDFDNSLVCSKLSSFLAFSSSAFCLFASHLAAFTWESVHVENMTWLGWLNLSKCIYIVLFIINVFRCLVCTQRNRFQQRTAKS